MLIVMRERMIELGVREAPRMVGPRQGKKGRLSAGVLEQARTHAESLAYDSRP